MVDDELDRVVEEIRQISNLEAKLTEILRRAIDDVLRGDTTKRYSIEQLTPEEKKHIGTHVEIGIKRDLFSNRAGEVLDTTVAGVEVDIKNTIRQTWMIPPEAVGKICLLVRIDEPNRSYSVGILRTRAELLNEPNQDKKRSVSKEGTQTITPIASGGLRSSVFLSLDQTLRQRIFEQSSGQRRVRELFRTVVGQPIHRSDIAVVAAGEGRQIDLRARVRDTKQYLINEGLTVYRGWNATERNLAAEAGYDISSDQCISVRNS